MSTNKARRLEAEKRSRWTVSSDEPRDHQAGLLRTLWSPILSSDAVSTLFPPQAGSMVSTGNMMLHDFQEQRCQAAGSC